MLALRNVLLAVAVVGLSLSSSEAEARFGKRSSSSSSSSKKKEEKSKVHDASAVGHESPGSDDDDDEEEPYSPPPRSAPSRSRVVIVDPLPEPTYYVPPAPSVVTESAPAQAAHGKPGSNVRLGADGTALGIGTAVTAFLAFEGERMGLDLRGTGLTLATDDGTAGTDTITLMSLHLTYALIARENLRLRLEGGFSGAQAPDLSVAAPSIALSLEGCLLPWLDVELRTQATPFPYQQLEGQAALALRAKALVLRGGWRGIYLNDRGLVDGVEHEDAFSGPYVGLGLTF